MSVFVQSISYVGKKVLFIFHCFNIYFAGLQVKLDRFENKAKQHT